MLNVQDIHRRHKGKNADSEKSQEDFPASHFCTKTVCYAALLCPKKLLNQKLVDEINGFTCWNLLLLPGPHLAEVLDPGPLDWRSVAVPWMNEKGESFGWKTLRSEGDLCFSRHVKALSLVTQFDVCLQLFEEQTHIRGDVFVKGT